MKIETMVQVFGLGLAKTLEEQCCARDNCVVRNYNERFQSKVEVNRGYHRGHAFVQLCVEGDTDLLAQVLNAAARTAENGSVDSHYRDKALFIPVIFTDVLNCFDELVNKFYPGKRVPDKTPFHQVLADFAEKHTFVAWCAQKLYPIYLADPKQKHNAANQRDLEKCKTWDQEKFQQYFLGLEKQYHARKAELAKYKA